MIELRQKLLMDLFREFRDDDFHKGSGSYQPGRRLHHNAKPIDRVYQTVDRYLELGYTENIIEYYKKLHLAPLKERAFQRQKDDRVKKTREQKEKNLKFIEENKLVEHPKYKGYYGVKDGRVFSNSGAYGSIRELKPVYQKHNNGYYMLHLWIDKERVQISWHQFIAQIFIPNPKNLREINHIDEDKGNCCVENLEWSTRLDNIRHSADNWGSDYIVENIITGETSEIKNLSKWCQDNKINIRSVWQSLQSKRKIFKKKYVFTRIEGTHKFQRLTGADKYI